MFDFNSMWGGRRGNKILSEVILEDPEIPEQMKIGLRIIDAADDLNQKIRRMVERFVDVEVLEDPWWEEKYAGRREVLEYLQLVNAGVDAFLEIHSAPPAGGTE